jgi:hypothetical protein
MGHILGWLIGLLVALALVWGPLMVLVWLFPGPWYQPLLIATVYATCIVAVLLLSVRPWSYPRKETPCPSCT